MNKISNRQIICDVLMEQASKDKNIVVVCSDSRGSASLTPFFEKYPEQSVEVGIAEQNLVGISSGLASCGKKVFCFSPASFLSSRSLEQIKVDCAYSNTSVKLIGISGGISYGALGMTHHSVQDIAAIAAIPNMRVYLPSDRHQTRWLIEALIDDDKPAYIRIGRNPVEDVYNDDNKKNFQMDQATLISDGNDATIIACGELVYPAKIAADILGSKGISCRVIDMYCIKPIDHLMIKTAASETKCIVTIEEHSYFGGMGSMVSQIAAELGGIRVKNLSLPDKPVIAGKSTEVFDYYHLNAEGLTSVIEEILA